MQRHVDHGSDTTPCAFSISRFSAACRFRLDWSAPGRIKAPFAACPPLDLACLNLGLVFATTTPQRPRLSDSRRRLPFILATPLPASAFPVNRNLDRAALESAIIISLQTHPRSQPAAIEGRPWRHPIQTSPTWAIPCLLSVSCPCAPRVRAPMPRLRIVWSSDEAKLQRRNACGFSGHEQWLTLAPARR